MSWPPIVPALSAAQREVILEIARNMVSGSLPEAPAAAATPAASGKSLFDPDASPALAADVERQGKKGGPIVLAGLRIPVAQPHLPSASPSILWGNIPALTVLPDTAGNASATTAELPRPSLAPGEERVLQARVASNAPDARSAAGKLSNTMPQAPRPSVSSGESKASNATVARHASEPTPSDPATSDPEPGPASASNAAPDVPGSDPVSGERKTLTTESARNAPDTGTLAGDTTRSLVQSAGTAIAGDTWTATFPGPSTDPPDRQPAGEMTAYDMKGDPARPNTSPPHQPAGTLRGNPDRPAPVIEPASRQPEAGQGSRHPASRPAFPVSVLRELPPNAGLVAGAAIEVAVAMQTDVQGSAAQRADILASFVLNAHFLPGWPPARPFSMPDPKAAVHQMAHQMSLSRDEQAILVYLASFGLSEQQLRTLLRNHDTGIRRGRILVALMVLLAGIGTLTRTLRHELANLAEELIQAGAVPDPQTAFRRNRLLKPI